MMTPNDRDMIVLGDSPPQDSVVLVRWWNNSLFEVSVIDYSPSGMPDPFEKRNGHRLSS
jgi:hypothetical protein